MAGEEDSGTSTKRIKIDLVQSPAVPTMKPVLASPVPTTELALASPPRTPIKESTPAPRTLKEPTSAPTSPPPKSTAEAAPPPLPPSTAEPAPPLSPPSTAAPAPAPAPPLLPPSTAEPAPPLSPPSTAEPAPPLPLLPPSTVEPAPPLSPPSTAEPAPPPPTLTNEGSDQKGYRELTKEEYKAYLNQVRESDGFDVKNLPRCTLLAPIQPVRMDSLPACFDLKLYSQRALDEYNRRFQGELEFVKILKVTYNALKYFYFYMTLEAKDLADGGYIKTYQTRVKRVSKNDFHVLSFRLKPPQDEQGSSNQEKEWFWKEPC